MILNYYGVAITQEQIVARTYRTDPFGRLPNWGGSLRVITANLHNWSIDYRGRRYLVTASLNVGVPTPAILLEELSQGRPVIVAYQSGPSGHAVVVTDASFIRSARGPIVQSVVVRDPWPSPQTIRSRGRVEYPGAQIASLMQAYWYIRVR